MTDAIEIVGHTLICDAAGCDHAEPVSPPYQAKVGASCPKCGANLLTQADCDAMESTDNFLALFNKAIGPIEASGIAVPMSVNPHDGQINLKIGDR